MSLDLVLLIIAAVCFALAAIGVQVKQYNLIAAGLFFWVLSVII